MLKICQDASGICEISYENEDITGPDERYQDTELLIKAAAELTEYFDGKRKVFDLPLSMHGTGFQKKVWECLLQIPYGETRTYKEIAAMTGNAKACRAVGMANHSNPVSIVVPCHRVIGSDGKLTGYAGGLELKEKLLLLEQNNK